MLEVAAGGLALGDEHVPAEQDRRDEQLADVRLRVDLLADERAQTNVPCEWPISTTPWPSLSFFR